MLDNFGDHGAGLNGPSESNFEIVPGPDELREVPRALWVGGKGDLTVKSMTGEQVTFVGVEGLLPIRVNRVLSASATDILGMGSAPHTVPKIELVTNGSFNNGTAGWTGLVVVDGVARTFDVTGTQVISTTAGVEYLLTLDCDAKGVVPQLAIQNGNVTGSPVIVTIGPTGSGIMVPQAATFTALGPESIIVISNGSNTALWDNISITNI